MRLTAYGPCSRKCAMSLCRRHDFQRLDTIARAAMLMSMDVTRDDGRAQVMNQAIWPDHAHCVTALHLRIEVATAAWRRRVLLSNRYEFLVVCLQHLQLDDACTLMRSFFHPEWLGLGGSLSTEPKKSLLRALRHSTPIDGTEYLLAFMLNERG